MTMFAIFLLIVGKFLCWWWRLPLVAQVFVAVLIVLFYFFFPDLETSTAHECTIMAQRVGDCFGPEYNK